MKILNCWSTAVFTIICSAWLMGCANNYSNRTTSYPRMIERANKAKRYIIMYSGVDTYRVASVEVEKTNEQFTVYLKKLDSLHAIGLRNPATLTDRLMQMYMRDSTSYTLDEPHTIPISKVAKIELAR